MKFETFYPSLEPMVSAIASEFGRKGHRYGAEADDFKQEFVCWLLDHEELVAEWMDPEVDERESSKFLGKCLRNEARDYLTDIKAQALGYERHDVYHYSKNEVKALLPAMFDPEKWHEPPASDGRSTKAPAEGGNWIATLADVAQAYEKLGQDDQALLAWFHRDGWMNKMVAQVYDVSEAVASYRHHRALKRLVDHLGGERPSPSRSSSDPWRGRHAVSNSTARAVVANQYEVGL